MWYLYILLGHSVMNIFSQGNIGNRGALGLAGPAGIPGARGSRGSKGEKGYAGLMVIDPMYHVSSILHIVLCHWLMWCYSWALFSSGSRGIERENWPIWLIRTTSKLVTCFMITVFSLRWLAVCSHHGLFSLGFSRHFWNSGARWTTWTEGRQSQFILHLPSKQTYQTNLLFELNKKIYLFLLYSVLLSSLTCGTNQINVQNIK